MLSFCRLWQGAKVLQSPEKSGSRKAVTFIFRLVTKEQFGHDKEGAARQLIIVGEDEQKAGKVSFRLENVPAGIYAIMAFQDVNDDNTLNSGAFGPKEPWGNYQQHRPKFSGPRFEKMAFEVKENTTGILIKLK